MLTKSPKENIQVVKKIIDEVYADYPIVAQLCIAQAILEAALWKSPPSSLAKKYNNLFGIKGKGSGGTVNLKTTECTSTRCYNVVQGFAVYKTIRDSVLRHRSLMLNGTKSKPDRYHGVFKAKTLEEAAKAVKDGGYATDNSYVKKLVDTYNRYINDKS